MSDLSKRKVTLVWTAALLCTAPTLLIFLGWSGIAPVAPFLFAGIFKANPILISFSLVYALIYGTVFYGVSALLAYFVFKAPAPVRSRIVVFVLLAILTLAFFPIYSVGGAGGGTSGNLFTVFLKG